MSSTEHHGEENLSCWSDDLPGVHISCDLTKKLTLNRYCHSFSNDHGAALGASSHDASAGDSGCNVYTSAHKGALW